MEDVNRCRLARETLWFVERGRRYSSLFVMDILRYLTARQRLNWSSGNAGQHFYIWTRRKHCPNRVVS
eukprot:XP_001704261.1 Hypothetical protein GL50803_119703 [Giardia lamblia ATCC 50803]